MMKLGFNTPSIFVLNQIIRTREITKYLRNDQARSTEMDEFGNRQSKDGLLELKNK